MRNIVSSRRLYHTAVSASLPRRRFCALRPSRPSTFIAAQHHHWRPLTLTALGCSAVGVGVFNQHESFKPTNKTLVENPYSSLKQTGDKAHVCNRDATNTYMSKRKTLKALHVLLVGIQKWIIKLGFKVVR
ncbi:uncharacterized protein LOC131641339 [Vicia villosa]|uniref:uncharacterized protein LOC131641339 n=1 Tax=Vicia villosa TaxID=3911 RepID=UPI00273B3487|nr:uncharacterized protein LOC131641339 [Vicia villosa]